MLQAMSEFAHFEKIWAHLPACVAAAREGTLVGAAARLGVDRTTVSRALQQAEQGLGARLFERKAGRLELTEAGRRFIAIAEAAQTRVQAAAGEVLQSGYDQPPVRIAIPTNLARVVAPAIFDLLDNRPGLRLIVSGGYGLDDLGAREADIALRVLKRAPGPEEFAEKLCDLRGRMYRARAWKGRDRRDVARFAGDMALGGVEGDKERLIVKGIVEQLEFVACAGQGRLADFMAQDDPRLEAVSDRLPSEGWSLWLVTPRALRNLEPYAWVFDALRRLRLPQ